jgi:hypothetical protein
MKRIGCQVRATGVFAQIDKSHLCISGAIYSFYGLHYKAKSKSDGRFAVVLSMRTRQEKRAPVRTRTPWSSPFLILCKTVCWLTCRACAAVFSDTHPSAESAGRTDADLLRAELPRTSLKPGELRFD